jgi:hypothetical protein
MFRTEVVKTNNIRRTLAFKITNIATIVIVVAFVSISLGLFGKESAVTKFYWENFSTVVRPILLVVVILAIGFSLISRFQLTRIIRIGSLQMNENEIKFLIDDKVKTTIRVEELTSVELEYFSLRMRNNPFGCMNYLTFNTQNETTQYEIVIGNSMEKSELGDVLRSYRKAIPVKIKYSIPLKKLIGDSDFRY